MCGIAGMIDWRAATPADTLRAARRLWEISERQCAVSGRSAEARVRLLLLRINFIDVPPERAGLFVGDLFERRAIDNYLFSEESVLYFPAHRVLHP
jgi:hypothetical protein